MNKLINGGGVDRKILKKNCLATLNKMFSLLSILVHDYLWLSIENHRYKILSNLIIPNIYWLKTIYGSYDLLIVFYY